FSNLPFGKSHFFNLYMAKRLPFPFFTAPPAALIHFIFLSCFLKTDSKSLFIYKKTFFFLFSLDLLKSFSKSISSIPIVCVSLRFGGTVSAIINRLWFI